MTQTKFNELIMNAFDEEFVATQIGNEFEMYEKQMEMAKNFSEMTFDDWSAPHADSLEAVIRKIYGTFNVSQE